MEEAYRRPAESSVEDDGSAPAANRTTIGVRGFAEDKPLQDTNLLRRAIREQWDIPSRVYKYGPSLMAEMMEDEQRDDKTRQNAQSLLLKMHGQNIDASRPDAKLGNLTLNIGVVAAQETDGLTEEELNRTVDERIALLASIESKSVPADG